MYKRQLVEELGVSDDVHIWVLGNEFAQALHGELMRFGLTHVEGDLELEVFPVSYTHLDVYKRQLKDIIP